MRGPCAPISAAVLIAALAGCDTGTSSGTTDPTGCADPDLEVALTVTDSGFPVFSWEPDCAMSGLGVEDPTDNSFVWSLLTEDTSLVPPVTYGQVPEGIGGGGLRCPLPVGQYAAILILDLEGIAAGNPDYAASETFDVSNSPGETRSMAQVSSGGEHTCVVSSSGDAYCWGANHFGQLGNDDPTSYGEICPVKVVGGHEWAMITAGDITTCGVTADGAAYCWGLLPGDFEGTRAVTEVFGEHQWQFLDAGIEGLCGITTEGDAYCWPPPIGDPQESSSLVSGGHEWASIARGNAHVCGLTTVGEAWCWGLNSNGKLGIDSSVIEVPDPTQVVGSHDWVSIATGYDHTCGLTAAGEAYCWGENNYGQIGDGSTTDRRVPTLVAGGHSWTAISTGSQHTCGVTTDQDLYCWGYYEDGSPRDGAENAPTPLPFGQGLTWSVLSPGAFHNCGLASPDVVYCWGSNGSGQLGTSTRHFESSPVPVLFIDP